MRDGQAGLGHPPWPGGGVATADRSAKGFLEGSQRPEAGCNTNSRSIGNGTNGSSRRRVKMVSNVNSNGFNAF